MEIIGKIISVQVGSPVTYSAEGPDKKEWRSAIVKTAVEGPVWLRALGLDGDAQADRRAHGGPDRPANCYPGEHYETWRADARLAAMTGGAFGENLTTQGLLETNTCIGDVYRVGEALVEVSQPRGPCYKLDRRWHVDDLMDRAIASGWTGWYVRAIEEGRVAAGDSIAMVKRPFPRLTVARVWALRTLHEKPGKGARLSKEDREDLLALAGCPALPADWRELFNKRLE